MPEKENKSNVPIDGFEKPISVAPLTMRPLVPPKDVIQRIAVAVGHVGKGEVLRRTGLKRHAGGDGERARQIQDAGTVESGNGLGGVLKRDCSRALPIVKLPVGASQLFEAMRSVPPVTVVPPV